MDLRLLSRNNISLMSEVIRLLKMSQKVYRERGFFSLVTRIVIYIRDLFWGFFISAGDVLYVSGCPGGSKLYRCSNQAEWLRRKGYRVSIIAQSDARLFAIQKKFQIVIFQRPISDVALQNLLVLQEQQGKTVLFETDDLVFDSSFLPYMHYYQHMGEEERKWYEYGIGRDLLESDFVKHCIVSTDYLARIIREKYPNKTVFVVKNKLNKKQLAWAQEALLKKNELKKNDGKIRIGYFSGSRSHDMDFDTVSEVLLKILRENKNVILMIVGHLELNGKFQEFSQQIESYPFVPMNKLSELLLLSDINIAPLEIDNPFCQGKSALKFMEAGALEVPTIASATDSFRQVIIDNTNGLLASTIEDWEKYLILLISDEAVRQRIGKQARADILARYTTESRDSESDVFAFFSESHLKRNKEQKYDFRNTLHDFYRNRIKRYIPRGVFLFYNEIKQRLQIKFPESRLAHQYLDGLHGLEIGGSVHNPFGLDTKNVDYMEENYYKQLEQRFVGKSLPVDIVAPGDNIPLPDESQDFVINAHVIEHFPDPIKALKEWYRLIRRGGYIFMVVPHKERTFDKDEPRTTLQELIDRHEGKITSKPNKNDHSSVWITEDMVELIQYLGWNIVETQDADDKVGNGFTVVIQKS